MLQVERVQEGWSNYLIELIRFLDKQSRPSVTPKYSKLTKNFLNYDKPSMVALTSSSSMRTYCSDTCKVYDMGAYPSVLTSHFQKI